MPAVEDCLLSETRERRTGTRGRRTEDGGQSSKKQKPEAGGQRTANRRQTTANSPLFHLLPATRHPPPANLLTFPPSRILPAPRSLLPIKFSDHRPQTTDCGLRTTDNRLPSPFSDFSFSEYQLFSFSRPPTDYGLLTTGN